MSEYQHNQIPKPLTEQVFEWANEVLWQCELDDPNVQLYGRRGKKQYGVDLTGLREDDPARIVGVQCKLKGADKTLTKAEVRDEVEKAMTFPVALSEYIICTTAPDDPDLHALALSLSQEKSRDREIPIKIRVLGWGTMERLIGRHTKARNAFDPQHSGQGDHIVELTEDVRTDTQAIRADMRVLLLKADIYNATAESIENEVDFQITELAQMIETAPMEAQRLLKGLKERHSNPSGRLNFRIEANIASCDFALGNKDDAASGFIAAFEHDPENPKAQSNKALGLLIQQDWPALQAFCEEVLSKTPDHTSVAGFYVQGMHAIPEIETPLDHLPLPTHESVEVQVALARFYLQRNRMQEWYDAASTAYANTPDNQFVQDVYADTLIDQVAKASGSLFGFRLSPEQKSKLVLASGLLLDRWDQIRLKPPATQANSIHIPANLMLAYRLTGDLEAAVKIGKQALEAQPDEPVLIEKLAAALLEIEAVDEAASYIDRLPISADTVMMYYHLYSRQAQWMELRALVRDHLELFPVFERGIARAAETLAELHLSDDEDRHEVLRSGITAAGDDPRALAILAQGARRFGFLDLAEACYKSAREATNPNSASFATRYALAHEAAAHGDWRTIARMFYGHINMEQDSADLRLLARALINQTPIREQARSFFAALPEPIKSEPYYLGTYGVMQIKRGDYVAARQALEDAYSKDQNLALLNPLCETLFHLGQLESLHALVQDSTVDETPGETDQRMRLAHILGDLGHSERAISLGYRALCEAPKSAKISQYYMGLILNPSGELPIAGTEAGLGMYVEITNDIGTKIAGILGDDEDRPWAAAIDPVHPIASAFLGSSVGHSIVRPTDFEMERTWTLSLVQPAWLRAWYDLQENFERRFPDAKGIVRIDVPENDISALIEQIKRQGEREQKRAENYAANQFPLVIAAGKHRAGAVGFADYLLSLEMDVSTATGNPVEFERAQDLIAAHGKRGAVLDSFTAWRAAKFSFLPVLQDMLGPLSIASSELTALKQLIEMQDADRAGETMTTGYRSGQLFRQTMSQGERRDIVAWMETRIADIENHCAVEAVTVPDVLPQDVEQLVEITEPGVFSSLILAGDSRILVSEDLFYRRLGQEAFETKSVWLQAVARHAVAENQLSFESYVDLVRNLAIHRHGIVVFDLAVLTRIYRTDSTSGFYMLSALCRYLGHPSADRRSNVLIACTFLNRIWATCIGREARVPLATGQVLSSILGEHRGDSWDEWAAMMLIGLESGPREQLINWCYATGKPIGQAYEWLNQVRRGTL